MSSYAPGGIPVASKPSYKEEVVGKHPAMLAIIPVRDIDLVLPGVVVEYVACLVLMVPCQAIRPVRLRGRAKHGQRVIPGPCIGYPDLVVVIVIVRAPALVVFRHRPGGDFLPATPAIVWLSGDNHRVSVEFIGPPRAGVQRVEVVPAMGIP